MNRLGCSRTMVCGGSRTAQVKLSKVHWAAECRQLCLVRDLGKPIDHCTSKALGVNVQRWDHKAESKGSKS